MKPDAGGGRRSAWQVRGAALLASWALLTCSSAWAVNTCTVAAQPHTFNPYDTVNAATGTSSITVTCSHSTNASVTFAYVIALSSGSGSYAARQMTGTGDTLTYNLYTTAARATVWGDGSGTTGTVAGSFNVPSGGGKSGFLVHTAYGLIPGSQNVTPGAYAIANEITVTVTY